MRLVKIACMLMVLGLFVGCSCPRGDYTEEKQELRSLSETDQKTVPDEPLTTE